MTRVHSCHLAMARHSSPDSLQLLSLNPTS